MPATQGHPGNDYYVFPLTGSIQQQSNPLLASALTHSGWTGPYTWTQAKQAVNAASQMYRHTTGGLIPGGVGPGSNVGAVVSNPLSGVAAIGDFFNRLTQANTWVRVGEFVAGALLVYLGLSAAMRGTEAQQATQAITKPVKKAVDLAPPVRTAKLARSAEKRVARERAVNTRAQQIRARQRATAPTKRKASA